jgi:hypothetical protein
LIAGNAKTRLRGVISAIRESGKGKYVRKTQTELQKQLSTIEGARKHLTELFMECRVEGGFNIQAVFVGDKPADAILQTGSRERDVEAIHEIATQTKASAVVLAINGWASTPIVKVRPSQDPNHTEAFLLFTIRPDGTFTGEYKPYTMANGRVEWINSSEDLNVNPRVPFKPWRTAT